MTGKVWRVAILSAFSILFASLSTTRAQSSGNLNASPEPPDDQSGFVIKQSVRRAVVDVVVTDDMGSPVQGLKAGDFEIFENGNRQSVRQFDVHTAAKTHGSIPPHPALPPHTFMNLPTVAGDGPLTVILYDALNTPLDAQPYAHEQIVKFLKHNEARSQTAVFVLSDRLHLLRGFTTNTDELLAAIESKGAALHRSALLPGAGEAGNASPTLSNPDDAGDTNGVPGQSSPSVGSMQNSGSSSASLTRMASDLSHMESQESSALLDQRVDITLQALDQVARFLSGVPGRKNLIWLSGSFPASVAPDPEGPGGNDQMRNYSAQMKQTSDLLNASQVAVYPVDVRGLKVNSLFDASLRQTIAPGNAGVQASLQAIRDQSAQQDAEHASMDQIGEQTGGHAFYNSNGLEQAMQTASEDGNCYYTLVYAPTNTKFDGGLRRIKVKLQQGGYHLAYRHSYFADDLGTAQNKPSDLTTEAPDPGSLASAMQFGAPPAHELVFAAQVDAYGPPFLATPGLMEGLWPFEELAAKANHRKFVKPQKPIQLQRYVVQYAVLAKQLDLPAAQGRVYRPNLSFAVLAFDKDGNALSGIQTSIEDAIPASKLNQVKSNGYRAVQMVFVPLDAVLLRMAVRDALTNRLGSMEVKLPLPSAPLSAEASSRAH